MGASVGIKVTEKAGAQGSLISNVSGYKAKARKRLQLCNRLIVINLFVIQTVAQVISALRHEATKEAFQEKKNQTKN